MRPKQQSIVTYLILGFALVSVITISRAQNAGSVVQILVISK